MVWIQSKPGKSEKAAIQPWIDSTAVKQTRRVCWGSDVSVDVRCKDTET